MWIKNQKGNKISNLSLIKEFVARTDLDTDKSGKPTEVYLIQGYYIGEPKIETFGEYKTEEERDEEFEKINRFIAAYGDTNMIITIK